MKKLITKEQKAEIVKLAEEGHKDAICACASERWSNGYNWGYLVSGVSCLAVAAIGFTWDWLRTRN